MIPKIIWQTYKENYSKLPSYIVDVTKTWIDKNKDYQYCYMTDDDIKDFICTDYDNKVLELFNNVPVGVMKADMFRYLVTLSRGGLYTDLDTECIISSNQWLDNSSSLVFAPEHDMNFCQWTFAAEANNKILESVVELMIKRLYSPNYNAKNFVHYHTGPSLFTEAINNKIGNNSKVFCNSDTQEFCSSLISTCRCEHGNLTNLEINIDGVLYFSDKSWSIFRDGAVKHIFASQKWTEEYDSWIEDKGVINAGR